MSANKRRECSNCPAWCCVDYEEFAGVGPIDGQGTRKDSLGERWTGYGWAVVQSEATRTQHYSDCRQVATARQQTKSDGIPQGGANTLASRKVDREQAAPVSGADQ